MRTRGLSDEEFDRIGREYPFNVELCPTCKGAGVYRLYGEEHPCSCQAQIRLSSLYYSANIGRRFQSIGWDEFQSEDRAELVPRLQEYVARFDSMYHFGLGFTIAGPLGTGKTLLLSCVLKDLVKKGRDVYFIQWKELLDTWGSTWRDASAKAVIEDRLKRCELLGLDEWQIAPTAGQRVFANEALESVLRHRYNHALPTLVTTNLGAEIAQEAPRLLSLLLPSNEWLQTTGKDYRTAALYAKLREVALNEERLPLT